MAELWWSVARTGHGSWYSWCNTVSSPWSVIRDTNFISISWCSSSMATEWRFLPSLNGLFRVKLFEWSCSAWLVFRETSSDRTRLFHGKGRKRSKIRVARMTGPDLNQWLKEGESSTNHLMANKAQPNCVLTDTLLSLVFTINKYSFHFHSFY